MSRIVSFRGKIAKGEHDTIVLHTTNGAVGYSIKKFEIMAALPHALDQEAVVKIYSTDNDEVQTPTLTVDFNDNRLLAAGLLTNETDSKYYPPSSSIIFDNMVFNQDIYVTYEDTGGSGRSINYYIELEQMSLDLNENTVATLKDIRNVA